MERYSALEVFIAILLAALPMSRIAELALAVLSSKMGINLPNSHDKDNNQDR